MSLTDQESADFGRRLRMAREEKRLTQSQVAAELAARGVKSNGKATISAWEVGRSLPSPLVLRRLCRLYDCSADSLLWEPAAVPNSGPLPQDLSRRLASLGEAQRQGAIAVLAAALDLAEGAAGTATRLLSVAATVESADLRKLPTR